MSDRETDVLVRRRPKPDEPNSLLLRGTSIASWRIISHVASGGCGVVYSARHVVLGRFAAVKVLHAELARSQEMIDRFLREARAVNKIRHPSIVDIFDVGSLPDGRPYLVMELLAPYDLDARIATEGRLDIDEVIAILRPICEALEAAHRAGYIHRDLKARNIGFAEAADGTVVPKLLDFGIAKLLEDEREDGTCTLRVGTPYCMSPEQIRGGRVDARTDVYALGVLLHQMLTGRCPFESESVTEIERMHLETPPPPPSRLAPVSPAIDAVVTRALAKDPADRFASVLDLVRSLVAAADADRDTVMRDAIAVRVAVDIPDAYDDYALDDAAAATDAAAAVLNDAGFRTIVATTTMVLAARAIDDDEPNYTRALEYALDRALARTQGASSTAVAIRKGRAEITTASGEFVGGELLEVQTWSS